MVADKNHGALAIIIANGLDSIPIAHLSAYRKLLLLLRSMVRQGI